MGRKRSFLGFLVSLFMAFLVADAFAAGYTCETYRKYTSCQPGYYMTVNGVYNGTPQLGNKCTICPAGSFCAGGTSDKELCPAGTYGATTGLKTNACSGQCEEKYYCPAGSTSSQQTKCPNNWTSKAGAGARTQCYRTVYINKNGGQGVLTASDPVGNMSIVLNTNTAERSIQVYYNQEFELSTITNAASADEADSRNELYRAGFTYCSGYSTSNVANSCRATNCSTETTFKTTSTESTLTYYAAIRANKCTVTYDPNGGSWAETVLGNQILCHGESTSLSSVTVPDAPSVLQTFAGYFTAPSGGTRVIGPNGRFISTIWDSVEMGCSDGGSLVLYAQWVAASAITCNAGTYLPKNSSTCVTCPAGNYCTGGLFDPSTTADQGLAKCPAGTYNPDTGSSSSSACTICSGKGTYSNAGETVCSECSELGTTTAQATAYDTSIRYTNEAGGTAADHDGSSSCKITCPAGTAVWIPGDLCGVITESTYNSMFVNARIPSAELGNNDYRDQYRLGWYSDEFTWSYGDAVVNRINKGGYPENIGVKLCADLSVYPTYTVAPPTNSRLASFMANPSNTTPSAHAGIGACKAQLALSGMFPAGATLNVYDKGTISRELVSCPVGYYCPAGNTYGYPVVVENGLQNRYDCDTGSKTYSGVNIWTSDAGASARTQCYRGVVLNKNGLSGTLTLDSGHNCKGISDDGGTADATLYAYYSKSCNLPSVTADWTYPESPDENTPTTFVGVGKWSVVRLGLSASGISAITLTDSDSRTLYAQKTVTCGAGNYLKATAEVCTVCREGYYCPRAEGQWPGHLDGTTLTACGGDWTSDAGAGTHEQCYYPVTLDKNGFSATLTASGSCELVDPFPTANATLKVRYNTECTLPMISSATQTGYIDGAGWAIGGEFTPPVKYRDTISASTDVPTWTTYYIAKIGCAEDYYGTKSNGICSLCSGLDGTSGFYNQTDGATTLESGDLDLESGICYGTTSAGKYVETPGAGQVECANGGYCTGGVNVYYGQSGGLGKCKELDADATLDNGYFKSELPRTAATDCRYQTKVMPELPYCATVEADWVAYNEETGGYDDGTFNVTAKPGAYVQYNGTANATCSQCSIASMSLGGEVTECNACKDGKTTTGAGQSSCNTFCTNAGGADEWLEAAWNDDNTVSNSCEVNSCEVGMLMQNNACVACPTNANCDGSADWECEANYDKTATGCKLGVFTCVAGETYDGNPCPAGSYCPGGSVMAGTESGENGCARSCPGDILREGTVSSEAGSTSINACKTTRIGTELPSGKGSGDQVCAYGVNADATDNYAGACNINITSCVGGYYLALSSDSDCSVANVGFYSEDGDTELSACSALNGANNDTKTEGTGSDSATDCYNTCAVMPIENGSRVPGAEKVFFDGNDGKIPNCSYTTTCNPGYHVDGDACLANIYTVTLDHNGGESSTNTIYWKYEAGWYSDPSATEEYKITSIEKPYLAGNTFAGYVSGGTLVVNNEGVLNTGGRLFSGSETNINAKASWSKNPPIVCAAGTYYSGYGTQCTTCPAGSYCVGVSTIQDSGMAAGIDTCESLAGEYKAATDENGDPLEVVITSAESATDPEQCYATNVEYVSTTNNASGAQTCYYNATLGTYNLDCFAQVVSKCVAGYYLKSVINTDCVEVGTGYYSAKNETVRHMCPGFETGLTITTSTKTSESINKCKMGEIWTKTDHGAKRSSCYHKQGTAPEDSSDVSGYKNGDNCDKTVFVACDGGYWYDVTQSTTDCVPVGNGYYSPAQSYYESELPEPLSNEPGTSIKRFYCGDNIPTQDADGNNIDTADSVTYCVGLCEENYFCVPGEEPRSCADATNGEYPYSSAGSTSIGDCFATGCTFSCKNTTGIAQDRWENMCKDVYNSTICTRTYTKIEGVNFHGSTACILHPDADIPKECVVVSCEMNNYYNNSKDKCEACSSIGDGSFDNSMGGTMFPPNPASGEKACYKEVDLPCTEPVCPLADRGECSFKSYSADDDSTYAGYGGYLFYGESAALPGVSKAFLCPDSGWTCRRGYDKTDADNDPSDCSVKSGRTGCTTDSGDCIPCKSAPEDLCVPHVYTITLQAGYDGGADEIVYQKYKDGWYSDASAKDEYNIKKVNVPTRENWTFNGYYSGPGYMVIDANGDFVVGDMINAKYTDNMIFYAGWTRNTYECHAGMYYKANATGADSVEMECAAPYYCPGTGTVNVGETGCRVECPAPAQNTQPIETQGTVEAGQTSVTSCYANFATNPSTGNELENGDGTWLCQFTGTLDFGGYENCEIKVNECDAGYYNQSGTKTCAEAQSGYYSPDKELGQIECPPKDNYTVGSAGGRDSKEDCYVDCTSYKPDVLHSTGVYVKPGAEYEKTYYSDTDVAYPNCEYTVECNVGYDAKSGANPECVAKKYTVTLNKNGGMGEVAESVECVFDSAKCALPATKDVLTRRGYDALGKWCTNANGTGVCFEAGTDLVENVSSNGANVTLYAAWEPGIFEITLNAPDADKNMQQGPVYLKYAMGWFGDPNAQTQIENIGANLPERDNGAYNFAGYYIDDVMIVNSSGALLKTENVLKITDQDASAEARWARSFVKCDAGTYYSGTGSKCNPCEANHYCEAGSYETDSGEAGLIPCPQEGSSVGGLDAKNAQACYKDGMEYLTLIVPGTSQYRAKGTWTCNFETVGYTNCHEDTVDISWCAGGYWYDANKTATDCSVVGANFYSPEEDLERHECPYNGDTNGATTSDDLSDCQKRVDTYVSGTNNAKGSHVCSARMDGDVVKYDQKCQSDTINITWCAGGYWYDNSTQTTDCVEVGLNYYSAEKDLERHECPHNGETLITTASTPDRVCQKTKLYPGIEYNGPAVNGLGVHGCYYDSTADGKQYGDQVSDGYVSCGNVTMTECNAGYYWDRTKSICEPVGLNHFGPIADINNSSNMTGRAACPENGKTDSEYSSAATACYLERLACDIVNGKGEQTRYYDSATIVKDGGYNVCYANNNIVDCGTMCTVVECDEGFSELDGSCFVCPADNVCPIEGGQQTCAEITGGAYTKADAGTVDAAYCYADCQAAQIENAYSVIGRDYYGDTVSDTCQVTLCAAGYTLVDGRCVDCPAGMVCNPESGDATPKACAVLTGGTHQESASNSDDVTDCFKQCVPYDVVNGTAVPVQETVYYPAECEFYGLSTNGNPCEIIDGVCIESSCKYNFEMVDGICKPCAREYAMTYKQGGNCVVESCASGYHPNGTQCESDVVECTAPNAVAATQKWDAKQNVFGACVITQCAEGYHIGANACQPDVQACELENGVGLREWNHNSNSWDECVATKCNPGYTNNPSLTSELGKQCGRCDNMYSANGDLAASSYVRECEIAACMYQGEKYVLENNECRLICDTYSDETGTRRWNESRKKCERTCEPGYTNW